MSNDKVSNEKDKVSQVSNEIEVSQVSNEVDKVSEVSNTEDVSSDPPSEEQKLKNLARSVLNPNGQNPQVDQYIDNVASYLKDAYTKMTTTDDRDAAAKEIANDLTSRFENWVKSVQKEEKSEKTEELISDDVD